MTVPVHRSGRTATNDRVHPLASHAVLSNAGKRTAGLVPEDLHTDVTAEEAELGVEVGEVFVGTPCVDHLVDMGVTGVGLRGVGVSAWA